MKEKLEIKTITCHNVYNAGASLQAYALSAYLSRLGHNVEIINYIPDYLQHYELWGVRNPKYDKPILREIYNILKLPGRIKDRFSQRKRAYDDFTSKYLPLSSEIYDSNDELKKAGLYAAVFFAGSDQIWNTIFPNGKDPAFYLDFAPLNAVRASYAASFATNDIKSDYRDKVSSWIKNLDFVSVRESSALDILKNFGITDSFHVVDPVFLLTKEEWESLLTKNRPEDKYLMLYDFDNNDEINKKAIEIANSNGWKIYSVFPNKICDKSFFNSGPLEFIELIKNSEMVLSNSFHAVAFSVLFNKQFIVFDRKENINTRMSDLLNKLEIHMNGQIIDYGKTNLILQEWVTSSKKYIDKVLNSARKK